MMLFGLFSTSKAQSIITESFNYPAGTPITSSNWLSNATGNPTISIVNGNLSYANTIGNSSGNKISLTASGQSIRRTFTTAVLNAATPNVYSSMVVNVSTASANGDYFYAMGNSTAAQNARIYIRANGSGFSFGVGKTANAAEYETTVRDFSTNYFIILKYEFVTGNNNDRVKLYVNPSTTNEPGTPTIITTPAITDVTSLSNAFILQRGSNLEVDGINIGRSWNSVTTAIFDYGDAPVSYDNSKDDVFTPATHKLLSSFYLGRIVPDLEFVPNNVDDGEDNNTPNGDGQDEDAIVASTVEIRKNVPYTLTFPVRNTTGTKYLYGWIDFNNNGRFEANEFSTVNVTTTGESRASLTWTNVQTNNIPNDVTKLYMRIRFSDRSLIDFTGAAGGTTVDERSIGNGATSTVVATEHPQTVNGEVEDYQINVVNTFDYGDAPSSYENNIAGVSTPALHAPMEGFRIGNLLDTESGPASVTSPNENNTTGDNSVELADEDGITRFESINRGIPYTLTIPVSIPTTMSAGTKYLYGWLDLNGDGRFQANEVKTTTITGTGNRSLTLTWTAAETNLIVNGTKRIYLRLRFSDTILTDFTSGANSALLDERSIGNGATASNNSVNNLRTPFGEVEDYQLPVDTYDFGDNPAGYELNNAGNSFPARQIGSQANRIGKLIDIEETPATVAAGTDNNGTNGDGEDEDGLVILPVIKRGVALSFNVPVTVATSSNIIAWIDFNNDGKFQANEVCYTAATGNTTGYRSVATGTSLVNIWFRGTQTVNIPEGVTDLYARIRLTRTTGTDNTSTTGIDERSIADGASTGVYTTPIIGEVEDYRFPVGESLFDFGDVPQSYEMNRNGNARPARNYPTDLLYLGNTFDYELGPQSVAVGDDNNGTNGDGDDEDGISQNQLTIKAGVAKSFTVAVNNSTEGPASLYAWIDFNNNGRFEANEASPVVTVPVNARTATVTFTATQITSAVTNKPYMRIRYLRADAGTVIADFTSGTNATLLDERSIADGLNSGEYGAISEGEVEDYQLTIIRDFGDVPASYENGAPASHTNTNPPELYIGDTIDYEPVASSVVAGADNNGTNGDGEDEDGVKPGEVITNGVAYSLTVPVNTTITGTKYLYAWIDFNGDGIFNGNEAATVSGSVTAGTTSNFTLNWNNIGLSASTLQAGKVYVRLRLSATTLSNSNGAALIDTRSFRPSNASGEIEDYQFKVTNNFDNGDLPVSYETSSTGANLSARNAISTVLRIGDLIEEDEFPNSVAPGADNNGANGDGLEEDGIKRIIPIYKNNIYYVRVKVLNNTGSSKTFMGWLDSNNNGRFDLNRGESSLVNVPSSPLPQEMTLRFATTSIPTDIQNVYMRLRIANLLIEFPGRPFDGRAIGDGTTYSTPNYTTPQIGEIEDYRVAITTDSFDYGDLPDTYETSRNGIIAPARQAASAGLFIGDEPADEELTKNTSINADGDSNNFVDDEINFITNPVFASRPYTIQVPVTNHTGSRTLYGWIDFNQNGRFEANEVATVTTYNGFSKRKYKLTWTAAQTSNIVGEPENLALRLRISQGTLTDFTSGAPGLLVDERSIADGLSTGEYDANPLIANGEIEDHLIAFSSNSDFGDAPQSYEFNNTNTMLPARNFANEDLLIGKLVDIEPAAQSVAPGADSNGTNGDGLDEDGIKLPVQDLVSGSSYNVSVNVINHSGTTATLRGWIDIDGNGRFTANEHVSVTVPSLPYPALPEDPTEEDPENPSINPPDPEPITQTVTLNWPFINYTGSSDKTYMRLRLTNVTQTDNTSTPNVDERSIADGLSSGIYGISSGSNLFPYNGEVEDYTLSVVDSSIELGSCDPNDDNRVGVPDPMQSLFHGSIVKSGDDWLVFGSSANGNGTNQNVPIKVISGQNGFNFQGTPIFVTGASNSANAHQYILLSSGGLYAFGANSLIFSKASGMQQVPLPPNTAPGNVRLIDAGASTSAPFSLSLLTKTGEVWVFTNTSGSPAQGNGNLGGLIWHQVMLNETTPLTGITDVKSAGASLIAMDGENVYTWGRNVFLGNGSNVTTRNYATKMTLPPNITTPILQQDLSNSTATSYYLRDSAGVVFVLGANQNGQLGLGSTVNTSSWLSINEVNEEPDGPGNETDVTRDIPEVVWISANNHDSNFPIFSVITNEGRAYTAGSNDGGKTGIVGATAIVSGNITVPTAITVNNGAQMLSGKVRFIEAGGHVSMLVREGSDRYGYTGHTADGSDGCGGCTQSPNEFSFNGLPSTGVICGSPPAYDYGDLDERYNLGGEENMARHEIKFSQEDNPLKLGAIAPDSEDGPQFTESGSSNNASGDDSDIFGDDEDAFTGVLPTKVPGSAYTLAVPLTNKTDSTAYLYGFIDWNDNGIFDPNETVVVEVPPSQEQQTVNITWPNNPLNCSDELDALRSFVRLRLTTQLLEDNTATPADERSFLAAQDGEVEDYFLDWIKGACELLCYKSPITTGGTILDTNVGVSSVSRRINSTDNWPKVRKGAWLAMESKTNGFVLNRIPFNNLNEPIGINPDNFVEGMTIYDTTNKCMKIYTSKDDGVSFGWFCMTSQACPD
ncbi:hypothetical protein GCM10010984_29930 [Chishuiella changwenlii]|nr:GEVED domain-containing protein [Chishuiella changwenlii]GGF10822.1 hypothetical protein GCM10010984_29930 [Chishuiella changwenlii]